jgi:hypothetical protein
MWIEFSADLGMEPLGFDAEALERIEDSRASFVTAFTALNNSTPTLMPNPTVSAAANVVSGGRRLVTTGAVQFRAPGTGLRPFAVVGAGIMTPIGGDTTLELVGQYRLSTPSGNVFDETDRMILRYRTSSSFVVLAGLGYTGDLSPRSGWRAELRVMFGSLALETTLDTQPEISVTTPTGAAILNGTNPGLQFATNGLRTNLSAPALQGFAALSASGRTTVWVASGGYYWRF